MTNGEVLPTKHGAEFRSGYQIKANLNTFALEPVHSVPSTNMSNGLTPMVSMIEVVQWHFGSPLKWPD
jgi:hypothetical protein